MKKFKTVVDASKDLSVLNRHQASQWPTRGLRVWLLRTSRCAAFLSLCSPLLAKAQQSTVPGFEQFVHTAWTLRQGAPGYVDEFAQTSDGFLWIASSDGLFCFDGVEFARYVPPAGQHLLTQDISALLALPSGRLWIAYRTGGATLLQGTRLTHYSEKDGLPAATINHFALDSNGTLWGSTTVGLMRMVGSTWEHVEVESDLQGAEISTVFADHSGNVFAALKGYLCLLPAGSRGFRCIAAPQDMPSTIIQIPDGSILVQGEGRVSRYRIDSGKLKKIGIDLHVQDADILLDHDGGLWLGSKGIRRLSSPYDLFATSSNQLGRAFDRSDGLTGELVGHSFADREGNLWFAMPGGIDRFRKSNLVTAPLPSTIFNTGIVPYDNGSVLAISRNLPVQTIGTLEAHSRKVFPKWTANINCAYRDAKGVIWFGGPTGLTRLQSDILTSFPYPDSHASGRQVQAIVEDPTGTLWVSVVRQGIYTFLNGKWARPVDVPNLPREVPLSETADANGNLWFGYMSGTIAVLNGGTVRRLIAHNTLNIGAVSAIYSRSNHIWAGGSAGLTRIENDRIVPLKSLNPELFQNIHGIVETSNSDLWLHSQAGIVHIRADEIASTLKDPKYTVTGEVLNYLDGLPGAMSPLRPIPSLVQASDGRIWAATMNGAVWLDPLRQLHNTIPPSVIIRSVTADGQVYDAADAITLPKHIANLQIAYTASSLSVAERVRFRYKLDGIDKEWQDAGARRQAFYTNLAPGRYQFKVIACNNDEVWSPEGAVISLVIPPTFVQTKWFVLLCIVLAIAVVWMWFRFRVRQVARHVQERLTERLLERERIARELHDTLLQGFQGLILRFEAVNQLLPKGEVKTQMERALDRTEELIVEGRDRVKELRSSMETIANLEHNFSLVAEEMLHTHRAKFRTTIEGRPEPLHPVVCEEVYWIGREALVNAFRHANATEIEVDLAYSTSEFRLRFRDNGQGIDPETLKNGIRPGHWGLPGMHERAAKIGGRLNIWSGSSSGTEIELTVPGNVAYRGDGGRSFRSSIRDLAGGRR